MNRQNAALRWRDDAAGGQLSDRWICLMLALMAVLFLGLPTAAMAAGSASERAVDFRNDVIPVLTKLGCNTGACHGAAIGRGGFRLSLYGGGPESDYLSITRELRGRRINWVDPDQSLLLLKPTEQTEHGGGSRMSRDDEGYQIVARWIEQGAPAGAARILQRVVIEPSNTVLRSLDRPVTFRVTAKYADGTHRDVTRWTVFQAEDDSAVEMKPDSASATLKRRGRHIVIARYLDQVIPVTLMAPFASTDRTVKPAATEPETGSMIDHRIDATLGTLGISPSPPIDDAGFLRRLTLDLTGRLPTVDETQAFLSDRSPKRRTRLLDRLLNSDSLTQYWTFKWSKWLRMRPTVVAGSEPNDRGALKTYHDWLQDQIRRDTGFDSIASELLMASGDTRTNGPANFYRTTGDPREQAEFVSELWMGTRMRCANCHNHPLDRWTQDDYHGLAAVFAKVNQSAVVTAKPSGTVIHPSTLEPATVRIPGQANDVLGDEAESNVEPRIAFAKWLTAPENPYFAKAIVNRLWKSMMGRALVEPVDDFRSTNPATHPELLDELASYFVDNGYRLRPVLRLIATSDAYARHWKAVEGNRSDDRFYSHSLRSGLEPEVLADAISDVLGAAERYGNRAGQTRAVQLVDATVPSRSLDVLGRCGRKESCESADTSGSGLSQKLHLFNGGLLNKRIHANGGRLDNLLTNEIDPHRIIETFYLAALCRTPNVNERRHWSGLLDQCRSKTETVELLEDFVWGLLSCQEFVTK